MDTKDSAMTLSILSKLRKKGVPAGQTAAGDTSVLFPGPELEGETELDPMSGKPRKRKKRIGPGESDATLPQNVLGAE